MYVCVEIGTAATSALRMYVVQEGALSTLQTRDRTNELFQAIFVIFSTFQPYGSFINNLK
jgi:hypothetical protein